MHNDAFSIRSTKAELNQLCAPIQSVRIQKKRKTQKTPTTTTQRVEQKKNREKKIEKEREHFRSINFIAFLLAQQTVAIARTHTQTHMWKKNDAIA